jgi:hypothetical protein
MVVPPLPGPRGGALGQGGGGKVFCNLPTEGLTNHLDRDGLAKKRNENEGVHEEQADHEHRPKSVSRRSPNVHECTDNASSSLSHAKSSRTG